MAAQAADRPTEIHDAAPDGPFGTAEECLHRDGGVSDQAVVHEALEGRHLSPHAAGREYTPAHSCSRPATTRRPCSAPCAAVMTVC